MALESDEVKMTLHFPVQFHIRKATRYGFQIKMFYEKLGVKFKTLQALQSVLLFERLTVDKIKLLVTL